MFYKKIVFLILLCCFSNIIAQTKNHEWQVGVGLGVTKFGDEDVSFIGDSYLFQIPRLNVTKPVLDNLAIDFALSVNTFDFGFITNNVSYFSADISARYFVGVGEMFYPYVFAGVSATDSSYKLTPTLNIGAGATYWITDIFGLNAQAYYKYSANSFESMRSHIQITAGMVFALDVYDLLFNGVSGNGFCR